MKRRGRGIACGWYGIARTAAMDRAAVWVELDDGGTVIFLIHMRVDLRISPEITVIIVLHKDGEICRPSLGGTS